MPKAPTDRSVEEVLGEQEQKERLIGGGIVEGRLGVVNAKVVYLGSRKNRHLPLKGRVAQERYEEDVVEEVQASGMTPYDFSTHDLRGKALKDSMIPMNHPIGRVRGKPFVICKHPDHLWQFHRMRDGDGNPEFEILASGLDAQKIDEYFLRRTRALRVSDDDFRHVVAGATASDAVGAQP